MREDQYFFALFRFWTFLHMHLWGESRELESVLSLMQWYACKLIFVFVSGPRVLVTTIALEIKKGRYVKKVLEKVHYYFTLEGLILPLFFMMLIRF